MYINSRPSRKCLLYCIIQGLGHPRQLDGWYQFNARFLEPGWYHRRERLTAYTAHRVREIASRLQEVTIGATGQAEESLFPTTQENGNDHGF